MIFTCTWLKEEKFYMTNSLILQINILRFVGLCTDLSGFAAWPCCRLASFAGCPDRLESGLLLHRSSHAAGGPDTVLPTAVRVAPKPWSQTCVVVQIVYMLTLTTTFEKQWLRKRNLPKSHWIICQLSFFFFLSSKTALLMHVSFFFFSDSSIFFSFLLKSSQYMA